MNNNPNTTEKRPLPRMRTIAKALEEISAADPNTALTQNQLRKLVKSGAIPCVHAGQHTLINLDILIAYLASDEYQFGNNDNNGDDDEPPAGYGKIRRIAE